MVIQEQMGFRRVACFIAFVLLLACAASEVKRRTLVFGDRVDSDWGELDEDMEKAFWFSCRLELKESVEDIELYFPEKSSGSNEVIFKSRFLAKENKPRAISALRPHMKKTLLDCLRKRNLIFLLSGEERVSNNWYNRGLKSLFPRRRELLQSLGEAPAPSPTAGSPAFSPVPTPSSDPSPSTSPVPNPQQFFPPIDDLNVPPKAGGDSSTSPTSASNVQSNKKNTHKRQIVIAVVVTASVTFFVVALVFLCYRKVHRTGGAEQNDENPLLCLSIGSSHKSFSFGTSINNEKLGTQSFTNNTNRNKWPSSTDGSFYNGSGILHASKSESQSLQTVGIAADKLAVDSAPTPPPLMPPPGSNSSLSPIGKAAPPPTPPPPPLSSSASPHPPPPPRPPPPPSQRPAAPPPPPPRPPGPPPPPPRPSGIKNGPSPPPPPPPTSGVPPPRPPPMGIKPPRPPPLGSTHPPATSSSGGGAEADAHKAKLKPFFWDKVLANPDQSMVWHQIKSGSFQFDEEMIENLFGSAPVDKNKNDPKKESSSQEPSVQYIQIIDSKKSQNLAILLKALNVTTEEVCDALQEGNELPPELLQTLLKMAPTSEEELKLRQFNGELSRLGPAERFLKLLVDIPFAFKRLESLLFMCTLHEESSTTKESFATLEAACAELKKSRLFLKLLEAVLKTGNRMNDGTFRGSAQAFKLDTLLKLSDVKGVDGKTTLLLFVVQEIIRSEGLRAARASTKSDNPPDDSEEHYRTLGLEVVSGLSEELGNVKKAAVVDSDSLTGTVSKLRHGLMKSQDFLNSDMKNIDEKNGFRQTLRSFVQNAEVDVTWLLEEEKRIMALVKSTADYFHGHTGKDEGLRLFVIVRDFLIMIDKACKEVKENAKKSKRKPSKEVATASSSEARQPSPDIRQQLFPAILDRRMDLSSSDDDDTA